MKTKPEQAADKVRDLIDSLAEPMSPEEYRAFLEEVDSHVESRLECLDEESEKE